MQSWGIEGFCSSLHSQHMKNTSSDLSHSHISIDAYHLFIEMRLCERQKEIQPKGKPFALRGHFLSDDILFFLLFACVSLVVLALPPSGNTRIEKTVSDLGPDTAGPVGLFYDSLLVRVKVSKEYWNVSYLRNKPTLIPELTPIRGEGWKASTWKGFIILITLKGTLYKGVWCRKRLLWRKKRFRADPDSQRPRPKKKGPTVPVHVTNAGLSLSN